MSQCQRGTTLGRVVPALLTIACLQASSLAAESPGALYGRVLDEGGKPLSDANVMVAGRALREGPRQARTEWDGFYRFADLPPGKYDLRIEKPGYGPAVEDGILVKGGVNATVDPVLALAPPPAPLAPAAPEPDSVSAGSTDAPSAEEPEAPERGTAVHAGSYKVKRRTFVGNVAGLDPKSRSLTVDLGLGRSVMVACTRETEIEGELAVGRKVRVHAPVDKASAKVATSIKVLD